MHRVSGNSEQKHPDLVALGRAIRALRKDKLMSQEALADYSGIDRSHMGKIERGERNVTMLNVARIASALNVKVSDILIAAGL
ncbi:MAG: helix-turn-helix transcriptional regulator [Burkholderiales bacterium]|nr:helix-turn-helix transcriptional regulator [Burkholderiales bacterium]